MASILEEGVRFPSTFVIGILALSLALPAAAPGALAQAAPPERTTCVTPAPSPDGTLVWFNNCAFPVTVKWIDQGGCAGGCVAVIETLPVAFSPRGSYSYAACDGTAPPANYDTLRDEDWSCPA